jgi:hypothetical protein
MKTDKNTKEVYIGLAGLIGLILIIIFAAVLTPGTEFQGKTVLNPSAANCSSLSLKSIPSPIKSGQSAVIIAQTNPENWQGKLRYSANEGILLDSLGDEGSLIETAERVIEYSGSDSGNIITVQAVGTGNDVCLATVKVEQSPSNPCKSLSIKTDPSPLPPDQSAQITVTTVPTDFSGEIVIRAESGTLQSASVENNAHGENTSLMVTTGKVIYYNGGKAGEKIHVDALGENNATCKDILEIGAR